MKTLFQTKFLLAAIAILLFSNKTLNAQTGLTFNEDSWSFGEHSVLQGEIYHEFEFVNNGTSPIQIDTILVSDRGALKVDYPRGYLAANHRGKVKLTCNFKGKFPGNTRKTLTIKTKPDNSSIRIKITGLLTNEPPARLKIEGHNGFDYYQLYNNGKFGIEDNNGNIILQTVYDDIEYRDPIFVVTKGGKQGVFSSKGNCILPIEYDEVYYYYSKNSIKVRKGGYKGYYGLNGISIIPLERHYTSIYDYEDKIFGSYFLFLGDNRFGICDKNGKEVWAFDFTPSFKSILTKAGKTTNDVSSIQIHYINGRFFIFVALSRSNDKYINDKYIMDGDGKIIASDKGAFTILSIVNNTIEGWRISSDPNKNAETIVIGNITDIINTTNNPLSNNK